ncbi:hypothetical protein RHMOL_Rhmol13G0008500 [Rhododendron molle]|uniref:Uncharacterized protein n=1 Tax=Rhododendron molle TaxID=49168 RepID=A0ACC0L1P3_RHOML|nr:hypothetical protein RHMOL_Rhmol13G0008500 [Rhododendron molle]
MWDVLMYTEVPLSLPPFHLTATIISPKDSSHRYLLRHFHHAFLLRLRLRNCVGLDHRVRIKLGHLRHPQQLRRSETKEEQPTRSSPKKAFLGHHWEYPIASLELSITSASVDPLSFRNSFYMEILLKVRVIGRLQHLDIGNNAITSEGAVHVAEYVRESKSLVFLNLSMNDIGDEGAWDLGKIKESLGKFFRMLIVVSLVGATLGISPSFPICAEISNELKEMNANKGAKEIAESLKQNQSLANLDLCSLLFETMVIETSLSQLEISYNPIGPHGAKALFEVLKSHGNIKTLSLGWCQIGAMGVEFIADALKSNSTISTLDLRANGLGDEGAVCLAQSLKVVNGALTSLDLGFNEIRDDGAFAIARALKANENVSLTKLNLSSNSISKLGQGVLTDAVDHVYEMTEKEVNIFV